MRDEFSAARERLQQSINEIRGKLEDSARKDWQRSKDEAVQLWSSASQGAREIARITVDFSDGARAEIRENARKLQRHLISPEFESQIDELIRQAGQESAFQQFGHGRGFLADNWFAYVHGSLTADPVDFEDTEDAKTRRERMGRKLNFLLSHYREDVLSSARTGALFGRILGKRAAMRIAVAAGGIKLMLILGDVTTTVFMKKR